MFRIQGMPQIDPSEEKRRVRENVKQNVFTFLALCAAIRISERFNENFFLITLLTCLIFIYLQLLF